MNKKQKSTTNKIQKHNKYESVTLFDGETPTTLSVQEYKESL